MNTNPKTYIALKWSDLNASTDLTGFIEDQLEFAGQTHITKAWLADTLTALKDLDSTIQDEEDFDPKLTKELAEVAKIVNAKGVQIIVL